jgi:hypothetical protein
MTTRQPRPCRFCGSRDGDLLRDEPVIRQGWCGSPTRTIVTRYHADCLAEAERFNAESVARQQAEWDEEARELLTPEQFERYMVRQAERRVDHA